MKRCPKCKLTKEEKFFYKDRSRKDGLCGRCKSCQHEYKVGYYKTDSGKESRRKSSAKTKSKYPEKRKARTAVSNALKDGRLIKQPCHCGEASEAHHEDYSKPLDVQWLCKKHHTAVHK